MAAGKKERQDAIRMFLEKVVVPDLLQKMRGGNQGFHMELLSREKKAYRDIKREIRAGRSAGSEALVSMAYIFVYSMYQYMEEGKAPEDAAKMAVDKTVAGF